MLSYTKLAVHLEDSRMLNKNNLIIFSLWLFFPLAAIASIHDKSRAGIYYDFSFNPKVAMISDPGSQSKHKSLHFAGAVVDVPYNEYLVFGFSLDLFSTTSYIRDRPLMLGSYGDIGAMGGIISGKIRPQFPINFSFGDLLLFVAFDGGVGGTPALVFGSHNLSRDDDYDQYEKFPTPFPIVFNTAAKIGAEFYFSEIFGVELSGGFRSLWFMHPFVRKDFIPSNAKPGPDKSVVAYDLSSFFAGASLKMAF